MERLYQFSCVLPKMHDSGESLILAAVLQQNYWQRWHTPIYGKPFFVSLSHVMLWLSPKHPMSAVESFTIHWSRVEPKGTNRSTLAFPDVHDGFQQNDSSKHITHSNISFFYNVMLWLSPKDPVSAVEQFTILVASWVANSMNEEESLLIICEESIRFLNEARHWACIAWGRGTCVCKLECEPV